MSLSLKSFVQSSKLLSGFLKPVSKAYAGAAGYRQIGKEKKNINKIKH
jgi:ubiquinol-cytochrome c reductase subunit 7